MLHLHLQNIRLSFLLFVNMEQVVSTKSAIIGPKQFTRLVIKNPFPYGAGLQTIVLWNLEQYMIGRLIVKFPLQVQKSVWAGRSAFYSTKAMFTAVNISNPGTKPIRYKIVSSTKKMRLKGKAKERFDAWAKFRKPKPTIRYKPLKFRKSIKKY